MRQQIEQAIADRRAIGKSDEDIIAEFVAAGYPVEQARELVRPSQPVPQSIPAPTIPVATPQAAETNPAPATDYNPAPTTEPKGIRWPLFAAIGGGVLAIVVLLAIVLSRFDGISWLSTLLTGSPYADEGSFTSGLVLTAGNSRYLDLQATAGAEFVSADESLPIKRSPEIDEAFAFLQLLGVEFQSEGHARIGMNGQFDYRDEEAIEFSADINADVLLEPFIFKAAGSVRQADDRSFVRVTDVPTLFESSIEWMPLGEWVEVESVTSGLDSGVGVPPPGLLFQALPTRNVSFDTVMELVRPLRIVSAFEENRPKWSEMLPAQLAQAVPVPEDPTLTEEQIQRLADALVERPPFVFVGEPVRESDEHGRVYVYEVDLEYDNLIHLLALTADGEISTRPVTPDMLADIEDEIPRDVIEQFNELTEMRFFVRSNGDFTGYELETYVQPTDARSALHVYVESHWWPLDEGTNISVPPNVHPQTLEELVEEYERSQPQFPGLFGPSPAAVSSGQNASIQQSLGNIRSQAEIVYNRNGDFNYSQVCEDAQVQSLMQAAADDGGSGLVFTKNSSSAYYVTCNDSAGAYAVAAPLNTDPEDFLATTELWCIDSTGFAGRVPEDALETMDDFRCESEDSGPRPGTLNWQPDTVQSPTAPVGDLSLMASDHMRGNRNADVIIIEYCDYESPFCQQFQDTMQEVMAVWGETGQLAWVYRHFPLEQLHPNAMEHAMSAECVARTSGNEAFWDFSDLLYSLDRSNGQIDPSLVDQLAATITGTDYPAYRSCVESELSRPIVESMVARGLENGVRGTPHSIVYLASDPSQYAVISGAVQWQQVSQYVRGLLAE